MTSTPDPRRVAELFDAVVDLDPDAASHHLDAACAGEPALRAAVERLVHQDRTAEPGFLAAPAALISEVLRAERAAADGADEPRVAARVGRFALVRKLGEGAMGVVYVVYVEVLDRRVALKLLRPSVAGGSWLLREGRALGRLAHPNVVAVHEAGQHEDHVYLAMEFIEGPTLRAWLAERRRPFPEVLRTLLDAGRGLAAVHAAGLVHRDFKPENVLVGKDGRPRVADFGLAALSDHETPAAPASAVASAARLDISAAPLGGLLGTPGYLSPERLSGARATPASDQWSFCITLHHAAYGVYPFPLEGTFPDLARRVLHDPPTPPPYTPDVPAWLTPILLRGLAKDPAARYPSMDALLAAIEAHLPQDPDLDRPAVRRELLIQRLATLLVATGVLAAVYRAGIHRRLTAGTLVAMSVAMLALTSVVVALRWKRLSQNRFGRRAAALFAGGVIAILVHRLVAMCLGAPVRHILVGDLVVLATILGMAAVTVERWIAWLAATAVAAAFVGALFPSFLWVVFSAAVLLNLAILTADKARTR